MNNAKINIIVESVIDLNDAERQFAESVIKNKTAGDTFEITYRKNNKLLGGIRIIGPDWVSDGSLVSQLTDLAESLK